VGIDIESVREYNDSLARYTMNEQELQLINASEHPDLAFTRLWTMKEAVLKWDGSGITNNIKDALEGVTGIETKVNEKKGYVYSVYPSAPPPMAIEKGAGTPSL
jgi:4'-phosphopantetheinyl transferase